MHRHAQYLFWDAKKKVIDKKEYLYFASIKNPSANKCFIVAVLPEGRAVALHEVKNTPLF